MPARLLKMIYRFSKHAAAATLSFFAADFHVTPPRCQAAAATFRRYAHIEDDSFLL